MNLGCVVVVQRSPVGDSVTKWNRKFFLKILSFLWKERNLKNVLWLGDSSSEAIRLVASEMNQAGTVCPHSRLVQYQRVWYEPIAGARLVIVGPVLSRPDVLEAQRWTTVMRYSSIQVPLVLSITLTAMCLCSEASLVLGSCFFVDRDEDDVSTERKC